MFRQVKPHFISLVRTHLKYGTTHWNQIESTKDSRIFSKRNIEEVRVFAQKDMNNIVNGDKDMDDITCQTGNHFRAFLEYCLHSSRSNEK